MDCPRGKTEDSIERRARDTPFVLPDISLKEGDRLGARSYPTKSLEIAEVPSCPYKLEGDR
ncbi:hypothetical protein J2857_005443 [Neorhizobium galegae]|nr:hypothetical protein [Neorhizobium galegae]